jgi:6,7-dimethyl-8-ribityllumazine synthase
MNIPETNKEYSKFRFAIVQSRFNELVCEKLLAGAVDCLKEKGVDTGKIDVVKVPGAFEIPLAADKLASANKYDAIICIGAVIKGETAHFEYISSAAANGIMQVGLKYGIPVIFCVLTTYTEDQAIERAGVRESNKGWEAAEAALEMIGLIKHLKKKS